MSLRTKMLKRIVSMFCVAAMVASCGVVSVGAVNQREVNGVINSIDECSSLIQDLNQRKEAAEKEKMNKIRDLDNEIRDNENFLDGIVGLIADGEDHEADYNRLTRSIEESKQKKAQINDEYERELLDIDELLQQSNTEQGNLEAKLRRLLNEQNVGGGRRRQRQYQNHRQNEYQDQDQPQRENQPQLTQEERENVELWEQMAPGSQYDHNCNRQNINLCWLMTIMAQMNYFAVVAQENLRNPVQGLDNVIDYYLRTGGNRNDFNNQMKDDRIVSEYLNRNGISTCKVSDAMETDMVGIDVAKQGIVEIAAEQIKTHFSKDKSYDKMSPVAICGENHWITIVNYFEDTGNVLVVDSLNGFRRESKVYVKNINEVLKWRVSEVEEEYTEIDHGRRVKKKRTTGVVLDMIFTSNRGLSRDVGYYVTSDDDFATIPHVLDVLHEYF